MFGLGMPEILLILAIALIIIGPKKLPDLAKTLGRAMGEFKRSAQDFKKSIDIDTTVTDIKDVEPPGGESKLKDAVAAANKEASDPEPFTRDTPPYAAGHTTASKSESDTDETASGDATGPSPSPEKND